MSKFLQELVIQWACAIITHALRTPLRTLVLSVMRFVRPNWNLVLDGLSRVYFIMLIYSSSFFFMICSTWTVFI